MKERLQAEPGSFRDRSARIYYRGDTVLRYLDGEAAENWRRLRATRFFERFSADGRIIGTEELAWPPSDDPTGHGGWSLALQHNKVPFVSYPFEWSFGMLRDAALLHLDVLAAALNEDMILKDGSAYNVQWIGPRPVFIDTASFVPLQPGEPWAGYRQFCKLFLYPLMLQAYRGINFRSWLRGTVEGIEPADMAGLFSLRDFLRPGVLKHVLLHAKLEAGCEAQQHDVRQQLRDAGFGKELIVANVAKLQKLITGLRWKPASSMWSDYATQHSYTNVDFATKTDFVRRAAATQRWRLVWDLGGNVGNFSRIAAKQADYAILIDGDALAIDTAYRALRDEGRENILPLCVNLSDPSPGLGWRGRERKPLWDRGRPDLVLALALIHHLVISANIPLRDLLDWLADLGAALVIEFVSRDDEMVQTLLRNKQDQYWDYGAEVFERELEARFTVRSRQTLRGGLRTIYFATPN